MKASFKKLFCALFLGSAFYFWSGSFFIFLKANLAHFLIDRAWQETLQDQANHKPWVWADTWPAAKLVFPSHEKELLVLSGLNDSNLAFGPALLAEPSNFSETSAKVIGGHRDTHFSFLENVKLGEHFYAQDRSGNWHRYAISTIDIKDVRNGNLHVRANSNAIYLITCYPFSRIAPGGPLRMVVTAIAQSEA